MLLHRSTYKKNLLLLFDITKMKFIIYITFLTLVAFTPGIFSLGVIDGNDVLNHQFPYQVSIQIQFPAILGSYKHKCGGTIISPSWVVTAAHCIDVSLISNRVVAGTFNLSDVNENATAQVRSIDLYHLVIHQNYSNNLYDIALLKMTDPFIFNDFVKPLHISKVPCVAYDEINTFSGWGLKTGDDKVTDILQTANMTILTFQECYDLIDPVYGDNLPLDEEMHICVTGIAAPCVLDSGGPLTQDNRLIGLLSWLPSTCSDTTIPALFTNTGYFKNFIKQHVDDLPDL